MGQDGRAGAGGTTAPPPIGGGVKERGARHTQYQRAPVGRHAKLQQTAQGSSNGHDLRATEGSAAYTGPARPSCPAGTRAGLRMAACQSRGPAPARAIRLSRPTRLASASDPPVLRARWGDGADGVKKGGEGSRWDTRGQGARWRVGMEGMASKGGTLMGVPIQGTAVQKGDRHWRWRVNNTGEVRKQEDQKSKPGSWGTRGARRPPTSPRCRIRRASSHRCRRRRRVRGKEGATMTTQ